MTPPTITVRYFAGAAAAAGREQDSLTPDGTGPVTLAGLLPLITALRPGVAEVLTRCSFLCDGVAVRDHDATLPVSDGSTLDVLPPFAGG